MPRCASSRPDIVTIGSIRGLPGSAIQTGSLPFYAAKRAQAALAEGFAQMLAGTPVRSLVVHPPYLDDVEPGAEAWETASSASRASAPPIGTSWRRCCSP
jgi:NAD(P)-dependent dehydrogenase (short-subunit alcohol dehydrogenase family)